MPRLDRILRDLGLSASSARDALRWGKVAVDGVPTALGGRDVTPDRVTYRPDAPRLQPGRDVAFLHVDDHLVVVWKPAGVLSVPAPRRGGHLSVIGAVGRALGGALPVHRLDEHTSGVMMVARTEAAQKGLKDALERHDVERRYLALVQGRLPDAEQRVETIFVRDRGDGRRGSAPEGEHPEGGKRAVSWLKQVEVVGQGVSLVQARLETGRTHQVRIHLSERGCPVLGEPLYASAGVRRRSPRLALHAAILGFRHPLTGAQLRFEVPLADDLESLRQGLVGGRPPAPRPQRRRRR